jgi:hypothetical protein
MTESGASRAPLSMRVGELAVLGAGALGLVASLLPWYGGSVSVLGFTGSVEVNAWSAGAGAWLSMLSLVAAAVVVLVAGETAARMAAVWCWQLVLGLSVFSVVCLVARWASWPSYRDAGDGYGVFELHGNGLGGLLGASAGPGVGFYLGIVASAVTTLASVLRVRLAPNSG